MIRRLSMLWAATWLCAIPVFASVGTNNPAPEAASRPREFDFGFIASRHRDVNGDLRLKVLGPFFERATGDQGKSMKAVRPFYSTVRDPANDRRMSDYLWPVGTTRRIHDEGRWRWLIFYGFDHTMQQPDHRYRFWLIPFYFQSRDNDGKVHRALWPLGGTIQDFLGRDTISFAVWPLYSTSTLKDLSTVNYVWPLISKTTSDDNRIYRARFFPFYGVNRHSGKYEKKFVLWPFYTSVRYDYAKSHGKGHILFPLYGYLHLNTERTYWVIPPFFRYTKGQDRNMLYAPWPFYQRITGKDIDLHYIWPFWGNRKTGERDRTFYLWPIFWTDHDARPRSTSDRFIAAPFFSHTVVREKVPMQPEKSKRPVLERRHKFWPLYSYSRVGESSRLRMVELWPFAEASAVERNLAPFWSLYLREANRDRIQTEVLWGLYRHHRQADQSRYLSLFPVFDYKRDVQVDPPVRKWNILKGLIGYEREGERKAIRLLYFIKIGIGKGDEP